MCNHQRSLGVHRSLSEVGTPSMHDLDTPHRLVARSKTKPQKGKSQVSIERIKESDQTSIKIQQILLPTSH